MNRKLFKGRVTNCNVCGSGNLYTYHKYSLKSVKIEKTSCVDCNSKIKVHFKYHVN